MVLYSNQCILTCEPLREYWSWFIFVTITVFIKHTYLSSVRILIQSNIRTIISTLMVQSIQVHHFQINIIKLSNTHHWYCPFLISQIQLYTCHYNNDHSTITTYHYQDCWQDSYTNLVDVLVVIDVLVVLVVQYNTSIIIFDRVSADVVNY